MKKISNKGFQWVHYPWITSTAGDLPYPAEGGPIPQDLGHPRHSAPPNCGSALRTAATREKKPPSSQVDVEVLMRLGSITKNQIDISFCFRTRLFVLDFDFDACVVSREVLKKRSRAVEPLLFSKKKQCNALGLYVLRSGRSLRQPSSHASSAKLMQTVLVSTSN